MKLPVPGAGVEDVDARVARARPNSVFKTSSTLAHMKSTICCGV